LICGLDEAGRGPLAGPVCAACVILPEDFPREVLGDSKKLSPAKREAARILIHEKARAWGIGWASAREIDEINILQASLLAMKRAFGAMLDCARPAEEEARPAVEFWRPPRFAPLDLADLEAVADGTVVPELPIPGRALPRADSLVPEVMAASILAKTARDRVMVRYSWIYPGYGYEQHKGYPTRAHREQIARLGPSPIQRMSFTVR
jgi:ribonuclease HII